jgi:uroporphyrinogen decarboxylase
MRQAGRYLPEYRALRARTDFMTMLQTPELAVEVTLQPVDLLGVDAAIIFSDILVVPQAMGMRLTVQEGVGPVLSEPIRTPADLQRLRSFHPEEKLRFQLDAIRLARRALAGRVPLIGFAGGPWTLASYMIEGGSTKDFRLAKRFLAESPESAHRLLERLAEQVGQVLVSQVTAGAQVVQVFESWAGALAPRDFVEFALPHLATTVQIARQAGVPVIVFAPGAGWALDQVARATQADVMGIDWHTDPRDARARLAVLPVACQGNLDPAWLYAPPEVIRARTFDMIRAFGPRGYIANLGHGIFRDTPVEHARTFVRAVQEWPDDTELVPS